MECNRHADVNEYVNRLQPWLVLRSFQNVLRKKFLFIWVGRKRASKAPLILRKGNVNRDYEVDRGKRGEDPLVELGRLVV